MPTSAVQTLTIVVLLRLRFKLTVHARRERLLLAEEAGALAWGPGAPEPVQTGEPARALLEAAATRDLAPVARQRLLDQASERIKTELDRSISAHAQARARSLADDHARVRAAARGSPAVTVEPVLPADIIGLYVLVPAGL